MPLLPANLDYSDRDFDSIRLRLQALIRSVFPDWSDFNVANFGNILLELFAFTGDVLLFYQDKQGRESRIVTATQRKSLIALAKLVNFIPRGAVAATANETFTLGAVAAGVVTIPAGTVVYTADITNSIRFQLLADVVIAPGQLTGTGSVEHSESRVDTFTSTGLPNQSFTLGSTPYLDGSTVITADDGTYTLVTNFLNSTSGDRHFTVVVDQNDVATVAFGNGVNGKIPVGTIDAESKSGGGDVGNVEPNTISVLEGSFTDQFGTTVQIAVTNALRASGGLDRMTLAQIREQAPEALRVLTRAIAREDFEIVAKKVPGVARALMTGRDEDPSVAENRGILYIIPNGGGQPSDDLKDDVRAMFYSTPSAPAPYPKPLTFQFVVQGAAFKTVNVFMIVFFRPGAVPAAGALAIRTALASFFQVLNDDQTTNTRIDFGYYFRDANGNPIGSLPFSDIYNLVRDVPAVLRISGGAGDFLLNSSHADVPLTVRQFPLLGTVTIIDGTTGLQV